MLSPHFALYTLHSTLCTVHYALCTVHPIALYIPSHCTSHRTVQHSLASKSCSMCVFPHMIYYLLLLLFSLSGRSAVHSHSQVGYGRGMWDVGCVGLPFTARLLVHYKSNPCLASHLGRLCAGFHSAAQCRQPPAPAQHVPLHR